MSAEYKALLRATKNKRCGVKEKPLPIFRKGLLNAALDAWGTKNGYGLCPITKSKAGIGYWPKRRAI